ncbi:Response regulator receiver [Beggiatoa sp. PS]|nr:Response regulator receiver [Beggiatoa sp. PS]
MNIVLGMTEMLIEDTELTEEQQHYAESVMVASKQLMDILTNMLNFAQQFKGELKQVISEFQVHEVVDNVLKRLSANAQNKDLQISTDIAPSLYTHLRGNQENIHKVLNKLVDNAIKFTEQGEIVIRVQELEQYENKQWVRFEVIDRGCGITEEKQAYLFDIFSQVDGSSTRTYDGMGMGLAVAKMFTENMGGQIGIKGQVNEGSTFWFHVPLEIPE